MEENTTYASFGQRLAAMLLDGLIYGATGGAVYLIVFIPLMLVGGSATSSSTFGGSAAMAGAAVASVIWSIGFGVFNLYLVAKKGQTPGKMILKIKIVRKENGEPPGFAGAFLKEVVGRMVNGLVFNLGYLWMLWDANKQTWADKIAGTIVIKSI